MSTEFNFVVGDRIRRERWRRERWSGDDAVRITGIGPDTFLGVSVATDREISYSKGRDTLWGDWVRVVTPPPHWPASFKVGDRVKLDQTGRTPVRITAIGEKVFLGVYEADPYEKETVFTKLPSDGRMWKLVVDIPELWLNIYAAGPMPRSATPAGYPDRASADRAAAIGRLGVLHVRPDGTAEVET